MATIKQRLDWAQKNQDHPNAKVLIERYKSGKLNHELKKAGMKPIEIKPKFDTSKVDLSKAMAGVQQKERVQSMMPQQSRAEKQISGAFGDIGEDFSTMGENIVEGFKERTAETGENIARRQQTQKSALGELGESIGTGLDFASDTLMTAVDAVEQGGMFAIKSFLTEDQEEAIEENVTNVIGTIAENAQTNRATAPVVDQGKKLVAAYNEWASQNPEQANAVEDVSKIMLALAEVMGAKAGTTVAKESVDAAVDTVKRTAPVVREGVEQTAKKTSELAQTTARQAGEAVDAYNAARRPTQIAKQQEKVKKAVGRITQAGDDPRAIEQATKALTDIDSRNIKTYQDLNNQLDDRITALSREVDSRLEAVQGTFKPQDLTKTTKVGDEVVSENPMQSALDGLEEAYSKSGEAANAARIRQLRSKFEEQGLTLKEANDLAREYGIEFRERAFTKLGEPKQGFNAENYENVRKGVKDVVREKMPDDTVKELDRQMSNVFSTRDLTRKVADRVAKLQQRIKNRTLAQKAGGAAASILDLTTGGMLRGFVARILPSNMGNKAMNALDIQNELRANLKELDRIIAMQDDKRFADAFQKWAEEIQPGLSIRSTVRPDKIARDLQKEDFNNIVRIIDNPDARIQYEGMIDAMGLSNATDDELVSFLKEVIDEYEGVAERAVTQ